MTIDWDKQPLGDVTDADLARKLGVSRQRVSQVRAKRGIAPFPTVTERIDWSRVDLGRRPDATIARELEVSDCVVTRAREARRIAPFEPQIRRTLDRATLQQLYVRDQMSSYAIAEALDVSETTVIRRLYQFGLPVRSRIEALRTDNARQRSRVGALQRCRRHAERSRRGGS